MRTGTVSADTTRAPAQQPESNENRVGVFDTTMTPSLVGRPKKTSFSVLPGPYVAYVTHHVTSHGEEGRRQDKATGNGVTNSALGGSLQHAPMTTQHDSPYLSAFNRAA